MLSRVADYWIDGTTTSKRLLDHGVCATPMGGWGETHGESCIRFVFANEPVSRLKGLGVRVRSALQYVRTRKQRRRWALSMRSGASAETIRRQQGIVSGARALQLVRLHWVPRVRYAADQLDRSKPVIEK